MLAKIEPWHKQRQHQACSTRRNNRGQAAKRGTGPGVTAGKLRRVTARKRSAVSKSAGQMHENDHPSAKYRTGPAGNPERYQPARRRLYHSNGSQRKIDSNASHTNALGLDRISECPRKENTAESAAAT